MIASILCYFLIWILIGLLVSIFLTTPSNFYFESINDLDEEVMRYFVYSVLFWPISLFMFIIRVFIWLVINVAEGISKDINNL